MKADASPCPACGSRCTDPRPYAPSFECGAPNSPECKRRQEAQRAAFVGEPREVTFKRPWCDCSACELRDKGVAVPRCNWDMAEGARVERERIAVWLRTLPGDRGGTVVMSVGRTLGDRIEKGHHHACATHIMAEATGIPLDKVAFIYDQGAKAERDFIIGMLDGILDANERHASHAMYSQVAAFVHRLKTGSDHA